MQKQGLRKKKIIIGLTGSFGSGKTTAAKMFKSFGARVIDLDKIAHGVILPWTKVYGRIAALFGKGVLKKNGSIDRARLSWIVFNNKALLEKLNNITHPEIIGIMNRQIKDSRNKVIVLDAPLLIESGIEKIADKIIVVTSIQNKQVERVADKTGLSRADILKRIRQQIPLRHKARLADFIIDNNGTIAQTKKQAVKIWRKLTAV